MPEVWRHTLQCATALCAPHCLDLKHPCTLTSHLLSCRGDPPEPEYRSIVWATAAALRLAGRRVLTNMETKKMLLQSLVALMSTPHAKHTDPALLLEYLLLVKNWLLEPQGGGKPAALSMSIILNICGGVQVESSGHCSCPTLDCSCPTTLSAGGIEIVQHLFCIDRMLQEVALMLQTLLCTAS